MYRERHEMEKLGWVTATKVVQSGRPDKNVCRITRLTTRQDDDDGAVAAPAGKTGDGASQIR